jgi:hypothetical protein
VGWVCADAAAADVTKMLALSASAAMRDPDIA